MLEREGELCKENKRSYLLRVNSPTKLNQALKGNKIFNNSSESSIKLFSHFNDIIADKDNYRAVSKKISININSEKELIDAVKKTVKVRDYFKKGYTKNIKVKASEVSDRKLLLNTNASYRFSSETQNNVTDENYKTKNNDIYFINHKNNNICNNNSSYFIDKISYRSKNDNSLETSINPINGKDSNIIKIVNEDKVKIQENKNIDILNSNDTGININSDNAMIPRNNIKKEENNCKKSITLNNINTNNIDEINMQTEKKVHFSLIENKASFENPLENGYKDNETNFMNKSQTEGRLNHYSTIKRKISKIKKIYDSLSEKEDNDSTKKYLNTYYIHPYSKGRLLIDFFVLIISIYSILVTPVNLIFNNHSFPILILEIFFDFIMIIDFFISFVTAFYDIEENLITSLKIIFVKYLNSFFFIDMLAALPFNSVLIFKDTSNENGLIENISDIYRFLFDLNSKRLHKILIIIRLLKAFKISSENHFANRYIFSHSIFSQYTSTKKIIAYYLNFFIISHVLTCMFIFLGSVHFPNWICSSGMQDNSFWTLYLASLYFNHTTIFTVGYGDIVTKNIYEKIYNSIVMILGIMFYSFALTSISNIIKIDAEKKKDFDDKNEFLNNLTKIYPINNKLYDKLKRHLFYELKQEKNKILDFLNQLPISIRNEMLLKMHRKIIESFNFFRNCYDQDFIINVIMYFKPTKAIRNEILIKQGDRPEEMLFIQQGIIELQTLVDLEKQINFEETKNYFIRASNNKIKLNSHETETLKILQIRQNEHFGDVLMLENQISPFSLHTKTKAAELYLLNKLDLIKLVDNFPDIMDKIYKKSSFNFTQILAILNEKKNKISNRKKTIMTKHLLIDNKNKSKNKIDFINISNLLLSSRQNENKLNKNYELDEIGNMGQQKLEFSLSEIDNHQLNMNYFNNIDKSNSQLNLDCNDLTDSNSQRNDYINYHSAHNSFTNLSMHARNNSINKGIRKEQNNNEAKTLLFSKQLSNNPHIPDTSLSSISTQKMYIKKKNIANNESKILNSKDYQNGSLQIPDEIFNDSEIKIKENKVVIRFDNKKSSSELNTQIFNNKFDIDPTFRQFAEYKKENPSINHNHSILSNGEVSKALNEQDNMILSKVILSKTYKKNNLNNNLIESNKIKKSDNLNKSFTTKYDKLNNDNPNYIKLKKKTRKSIKIKKKKEKVKYEEKANEKKKNSKLGISSSTESTDISVCYCCAEKIEERKKIYKKPEYKLYNRDILQIEHSSQLIILPKNINNHNQNENIKNKINLYPKKFPNSKILKEHYLIAPDSNHSNTKRSRRKSIDVRNNIDPPVTSFKILNNTNLIFNNSNINFDNASSKYLRSTQNNLNNLSINPKNGRRFSLNTSINPNSFLEELIKKRPKKYHIYQKYSKNPLNIDSEENIVFNKSSNTPRKNNIEKIIHLDNITNKSFKSSFIKQRKQSNNSKSIYIDKDFFNDTTLSKNSNNINKPILNKENLSRKKFLNTIVHDKSYDIKQISKYNQINNTSIHNRHSKFKDWLENQEYKNNKDLDSDIILKITKGNYSIIDNGKFLKYEIFGRQESLGKQAIHENIDLLNNMNQKLEKILKELKI